MDETWLALFLKKYLEQVGSIPGRKAYQKLLYFAQLLGWPSDYPFRLHFYGPYSEEADRALEMLEEGGAVVIPANGEIKPSAYLNELAAHAPDPNAGAEALAQTLAAFQARGPKELELLATIRLLWDTERRVLSTPTEHAVTTKLKRLKPGKFEDAEIVEAFVTLEQFHLLPT